MVGCRVGCRVGRVVVATMLIVAGAAIGSDGRAAACECPEVSGRADAVIDVPEVVEEVTAAEVTAVSAVLDEDLGDESRSDGGIAPLLGGLVIIGAVLGIGLAAIRRQRAEGRRSKFPPIG